MAAIAPEPMKKYLPLLLLAACTSAPPPVGAPADTSSWYLQAAMGGTAVYAVSPSESLVAVTVRRAGLLARLGHDHVVASHDLAGFAAPQAGRADVEFRADRLAVDEPALLRDAGIGTVPSAQAIAGTRTNMLAHVLEADRFPLVRLHAERAAPDRLRVAITLHGTTRNVEVPVALETSATTVSARGAVTLRQSDFGITPFAVGGGLLAVEDAIEVRFRIVAVRLKGGAQ
jgi:polyisoprenoid-binding protein YceI